jgi:hypothetical protein
MSMMHCGLCEEPFARSSAGMRALYWHLRNNHGLEHDGAFNSAGDAMNNDNYEHLSRGWQND